MRAPHAAILDHVRSLGYAVSEHYVNGHVEMHAVLLVKPHTQHIVWCRDGDGPDEAYGVACELAAKVGIDLEG